LTTESEQIAAAVIALREAPEVSVVLPCLNEAKTVGKCIEKALAALQQAGIAGEVIVADNGSTDGSVDICRRLGVTVVHQPRRGYGNAYLKGIAAAHGRYVLMADADDTYDLSELPRFIELLRDGHDMVIGNRFAGRILPGAMDWSHRYLGNPILSGLLRVMFSTSVGDAHSGMRAFTREAYEKLRLKSGGMEFASEMVVNAGRPDCVWLKCPLRTIRVTARLSCVRCGMDGAIFVTCCCAAPRTCF